MSGEAKPPKKIDETIGDFRITEEGSKSRSGKEDTVLYIREQPYRAGFSIQATALNIDAARWIVSRIVESRKTLPYPLGEPIPPDFVVGSERDLHHVACNYSALPRKGCRQCRMLEETPLTADMTRSMPGGMLDDCAYSDIETALDRVRAPMTAQDGRWLTLPERVLALAAELGRIPE